jgi:serine/threonine-protein kinase
MTSLFGGLSPRFVSPGSLVFWRENSLWAVPFDPERLQTTGSAVPVVEGVGAGINDLAEFAVGGGTLFYRQNALSLGRFQTIPRWVGRDGAEEVLDTTLSGSFRTSAISPDGRKIAFAYMGPGETEQHIWIYDLGQRTFSRLTFEGGRNIQPFWSPDGMEVGFSSDLAGRFALYTRPVDLSSEARLLRGDPDADLMEGGWTPDGSRLVYRRGADIWHSAPDPGSDAVAIVQTLADERHPALSPDGRWLAYTSNEEGWWEVYIRPFPGPGGRVKDSTDGGIQPRWAHSGNEVFYLLFSPPWTTGSWMGASIRLDPGPLVESRVERFPNRTSYLTATTDRFWDVSPDDQHVLVMALPASEAAEGRYVVVQNFDAELRRLVPD